MRILNRDIEAKVNEITLYLTKSEAEELRDSLIGLLTEKSVGNHRHIASSDYSKEVTVCLYTPGETAGFDERSKRLILEDR
jgi:hypothetical protein